MSARETPPPQRLAPGARVVAEVYGRTRAEVLFPWHIAQVAAVVHGTDLFSVCRGHVDPPLDIDVVPA